MSSQLLIATTNAGKIAEIRDILAPLGIATRTPSEVDVHLEVRETGSTFAENAVLKARAFADAAGLTALADDSGLMVDALQGQPGVLSARYAGEGASDDDRINLILQRLRGVPAKARSATFVAVVALAQPKGERVTLFEGRVGGYITEEPRGSLGFGYDPIFFVPDAGKTFGEMRAEEKARHSHRGLALRKFADSIQPWRGTGILE